MARIRIMTGDDLEAVRQVDAAAFDAWWKRLWGPQAGLPRRTLANLAACRERDPEGCFVAEDGSRAVGYLFSRTWGGVGWLGPLGVLPNHQGRGIGRGLISAGVEYLCRAPGCVVGLETMSESPENLGVYLKQGFQLSLPTILLGRGLAGLRERALAGVPGQAQLPGDPAAPAGLERWSTAGAATRDRWLAELRAATDLIHLGLDYAKEITAVEKHRLGESLILTQGGWAVGLGVLSLVGAREGGDPGPASLQVLALHPAAGGDEAFRRLLAGVEALAAAASRPSLKVAVNARHARALGLLLEWGYRVERVVVRMVLQGTEAGPATDGCVNLSRWAG